MNQHDPFAILGIAPTRDLASIKRGYFAALAKSPPHKDPEAFRRVREAYETLSDPSACALAMLRAPLDPVAELAHFDAEWGARIAAAANSLQTQQRGGQALEAFVAQLSHLTLAEACAD